MKQLPLCLMLAPLFFGQASFADQTPCAKLTYQGEDLVDKGSFAEAQKVLENAVKTCRASQEKSARPYMALGTVYVKTQKPANSIPLFEEALKNEPGLALAYLDLSAAYQGAHQYPKSVEAGKKAIDAYHQSGDKRHEAEANFNVGLTLFKKAADTNDEKDLSSEPYFLASSKVDPTIGGNYFYLGVIDEVMKKDFKAAKDQYKKGCDNGYRDACTYLTNLNAKMASGTTAGASSAPNVDPGTMTANEKALYAKIKAKYAAKGVKPADLDKMIDSIRKNYAQLTPDIREKALTSMANAP